MTQVVSGESALEGALRYFAGRAPRHSADEEVSLFLRLAGQRNFAFAEALTSLNRSTARVNATSLGNRRRISRSPLW